MAGEWVGHSIRVNSISPGIMNTRLAGGPLQAGLRKAWLEKSPLGIGDPEDLTGAIILLCSDAGRFITGTDIKIDGDHSSFALKIFALTSRRRLHNILKHQGRRASQEAQDRSSKSPFYQAAYEAPEGSTGMSDLQVGPVERPFNESNMYYFAMAGSLAMCNPFTCKDRSLTIQQFVPNSLPPNRVRRHPSCLRDIASDSPTSSGVVFNDQSVEKSWRSSQCFRLPTKSARFLPAESLFADARNHLSEHHKEE